MILGLDHSVIVVRDLASAVRDYTALGFTVTPGGTHADGLTHNALIPFADGSYFELLAFTDPGRATGHPWWHRLAEGEGLEDYALASDDLAGDVAACRRRGLAIGDPMEGGRERPDGRTLRWRTARFVQPQPDRALPFLIEDVTPRDWRVPDGAAAQHAQHVGGIQRIAIAVRDVAAATARCAALLGTPLAGETATPDVDFALAGGQHIALVSPRATDDAAAAQIARHGEGPFALTLRAADDAQAHQTVSLDVARTHGAHIYAPAG
jgi:catechol 2,3-dioxygenase-like lactoylglutathione lyase family enzyme